MQLRRMSVYHFLDQRKQTGRFSSCNVSHSVWIFITVLFFLKKSDSYQGYCLGYVLVKKKVFFTYFTYWLIKLYSWHKCSTLYLHQKYLLQILLCVCVCVCVCACVRVCVHAHYWLCMQQLSPMSVLNLPATARSMSYTHYWIVTKLG